MLVNSFMQSCLVRKPYPKLGYFGFMDFNYLCQAIDFCAENAILSYQKITF